MASARCLRPVSRLTGMLLGGCLAVVLLWGCADPIPPPPVKEARGVWLTRYDYCGVSPTHDPDAIRTYIATVIDQAARAHFNLVFFQVRGNGDAYYTPGLEPWGQLLTGTLGEDPGWDPLEFALDQAHRRGLELHAWFNTFPVWRGRNPPPVTAPLSPYLAHPDWLVADSSGVPMPRTDGYISFSPGIPQAQAYIIAVAADIVTRYDVDGIHFDYIRYPDGAPQRGYSHDAPSVAAFASSRGNPFGLDWDDWQREQVTGFMVRAYNAVTAVRPTVKVSAATLGSYRDTGWNAYHATFQDPRRWSELGKVDFITPMLYWPRDHPTQPFTLRSLEWRDHFTLDRYVFPGIGSYRYAGAGEDLPWDEALGQIDDLRDAALPGMSFFEARSLQEHWDDLARTRFRRPANIPAMTWKDDLPPQPPTHLKVKLQDRSATLTWVPPEDDDVERYNIYLSPDLPLDTGDSRNLRIVTIGPRLVWTLELAGRDLKAYVAVSALDAAWNESGLSEAVKIRGP